MIKSTNEDDIKARRDFLMKMYETLNKEIDRHINSIWQIITVIVSALAVFALVEKQVLSLDLACTIIIIILCLGVAYVIEANYWYNRNLVIIANIERQFLYYEDLKDIHHYFGKHRENNELVDMMIIQLLFISVFTFFILLIHFFKRVVEGFDMPFSNFEIERSSPYLFLILCGLYLYKSYTKRIRDYNKFVSKSPGILVEEP